MAAHHSKYGLIIKPLEFLLKGERHKHYIVNTPFKFTSVKKAKKFVAEKLENNPNFFLAFGLKPDPIFLDEN